ncbi:Fes1-domain-containing protein [Cylindrobasidium torrendii FP15055 ss-10]|uniref:Fes1-domain-containing protein n=1 Tax=Cylindrobasidium torrendii FP15055 ss-10 TaxID=1314674 RepID=A0A0D7BV61_9AGAR|nr:Fes1-domain-containing protein [Cylindrobasidium torrendii FP15055 ss-10]
MSQSLLRWAVENTDVNAPPVPIERKDLDPAIIDAILGKSDAEQMKEDMAVATDVHRSEDERMDALDHMEMLIENIDNANDLDKLQMWQPLHALLSSENSTDDIKMQALWVIGTALQNNPSAQQAYSKHNPLKTLIDFIDSSISKSTQIRSKALYTLSGLLKHNSPAVKEMGDVDGWSKLRNALQDPDITVRRKTAFLLAALLSPTEGFVAPADGILGGQNQPVHSNSHAANISDPSRTDTSTSTVNAMTEHNILSTVVDGLIKPLPYGEDGDVEEPDADLEEKLVSILKTYTVNCNVSLDAEFKDSIRQWLAKEKPRNEENWGMSVGELDEFEKKLL